MAEFAVHLLQLAYFMLPAYMANMAPPFARFWRGWNRPIHVRLLGGHKTVGGVALGLLASMATARVQAWLDVPTPWRVDAHWTWVGMGFGIGAMAGDCVKSYCKRRRGIAPGQPWIPFDQLDFVAGSLLLVGPLAGIGFDDALLILAMSFIGDLLVNQTAYRLGIRTTPW